MRLLNITMLSMVCIGSCQALAAPCGLEHGYIVCHQVSGAKSHVSLSFAPAQAVTPAVTTAMICSENTSGVADVEANQASGSVVVHAVVSDHAAACPNLRNLKFEPIGSWEIRVHFNDGDQVTFAVRVSEATDANSGH